MADQRDDEIAELKARLAAVEGNRSSREPAARSGTGFSRGFFGCFGAVAAVVLLIVVLVSLSMCSPTSTGYHQAGAKPMTSDERAEIARGVAAIEQTPSQPCDTRWSETELAARRATGLVVDMDVGPGGLTIEVDQERLSQRPEGTLESLVEAADCAIAGPTGHLTSIKVVNRAGRPIANYDANRLFALRARVQD